MFQNIRILDAEHIEEALGLPTSTESTQMDSLFENKKNSSVVVINAVSDLRKIGFMGHSLQFSEPLPSLFGEAEDLLDLDFKKYRLIREKLRKLNHYSFDKRNTINQSLNR